MRWWRLLRVVLPGASSLLCLGLLLWLCHIGWPQSELRLARNNLIEATKKSGFTVSDIYVTGRHRVSRDAVFAALNVRQGDPLFSFDVDQARAALVAIPGIESASVERRWPDRIYVSLIERVPYARWQINHQVKVIDANGITLADSVAMDEENLPLVVGMGAPQAAHDLMTSLGNWPIFAKALRAAVRVGGQRWDLYLALESPAKTPASAAPKSPTGQTLVVKLPGETAAMNAALERLAKLGQETDLFARPLTSIDLRFADRLIVRPQQMAGTGAAADHKMREPSPDKSQKGAILEDEDSTPLVDDQGNPI